MSVRVQMSHYSSIAYGIWGSKSVSGRPVWQNESWHSLQCQGLSPLSCLWHRRRVWPSSFIGKCSVQNILLVVEQLDGLPFSCHWLCQLTDWQAKRENPSLSCLWHQCEGDVECKHSLSRGQTRIWICTCNASCPSGVPCNSLGDDHYDQPHTCTDHKLQLMLDTWQWWMYHPSFVAPCLQQWGRKWWQ